MYIQHMDIYKDAERLPVIWKRRYLKHNNMTSQNIFHAFFERTLHAPT
jgi:hypothetical protein